MTDTKTGYEGKIEKLADDLLCELDTLEQASSVVNIGLTPDDIRKAFKEMIARAFPDRPTVAWLISWEKWDYVGAGRQKEWVAQRNVYGYQHDADSLRARLRVHPNLYRNITVTELCEKGSTL